MSLLRQEFQDTASEESQENDEEWQEIAETHIIVLEGVIEEIMKPVKNGDKHPDHLLEVANTISMIASGIDLLENYEEKFERFRAHTSGLLVVLWQLYNKSKTLWPPPKFKKPIKEFVETVHGIHELMKRKSEENLAKRLLVGSFGIRNLGKFKKYRGKLGEMASFLEEKPNNVNIGEVLLEVVYSRAQPQDSDTQLSEDVAHSPTKKGTKKRADTQDNRAEGSRQRSAEAETSTAAKSTKYKVPPEKVVEDDHRESKASGKKKAKDSRRDDPAATSSEERSGEENRSAKKKVKKPSKPAKKATRHESSDDEGVTESDDKGKRTSQPSDDDDGHKANVPASDPVATSVPRKKKPAKQKVKSNTIPVPQISNSISGFSFDNSGPGNMYTNNVGNVYNSSISGVGNDYSVNYGQRARRKHTHE